MDYKKSKTILLVDDSEFNRLLIDTVFIDTNIKVLLAIDGIEALDILKKNNVDLILLDLMMPKKKCGIDIMDELKKDSAFEEIPIMMITAKAEDEYLKNAKKSGAIDYLVKPIDIIDILHRVKKILQIK